MSRTINGIKKESLLDHVYANNPALVNAINFETPLFGDHVLIIINLKVQPPKNNIVSQMRDWSIYSKERLIATMSTLLDAHTNNFHFMNVQEHWNAVELAILETVDTCAPLTDVKINRNNGVTKLPSSIKHKLNLRKRLLKIDRMRSSGVNAPRIRSLNIELKSFFSGAKATSVRRTTMGSKFNLWKAVKKAKNLNVDSIPIIYTNLFSYLGRLTWDLIEI